MMRARLRTLWIDGRKFVWRAETSLVRGAGDCHRCIRLRVWGDGKNSRVLQADLLSRTWPAPGGAWATDGAYPQPADVRLVIAYALRHGWQPQGRGGVWLLTEGEHAESFELPGFLLTDRPRVAGAPDPTARVIEAHARAAQPDVRG